MNKKYLKRQKFKFLILTRSTQNIIYQIIYYLPKFLKREIWIIINKIVTLLNNKEIKYLIIKINYSNHPSLSNVGKYLDLTINKISNRK